MNKAAEKLFIAQPTLTSAVKDVENEIIAILIRHGSICNNMAVINEELKQWISKQDTGTESNMEPSKGAASDAQKRAASAWGIGRELYSAPDIYINLKEGEYSERDGRIYPKSNLFIVQTLDIDEETRKITALVIIDRNLETRFSYPRGVAAPAPKKTQRPAAVKTTNVQRVAPTESQLQSMAKRIAKGEDLTDKIQVNFLMTKKDWMHLYDLIKKETQNK